MSKFDERIQNNFENSFAPRNPGSVDISQCILTNSRGTFNIIPQVKKITIIESLLDGYFIKGKVELEDGIGLSEFFPIIGEESLFLEFTTPTSFISHKGLYKIVTSSPEYYDGPNTLVKYELTFVSYEYFQNLKEKVFLSSSKVNLSTFAQIIYDRYIKVPLETRSDYQFKQLKLGTTSTGEYNICIPNMTPFTALQFLSNRSKDKTYDGAGFLFYEDKDFYNFTTVEKLYENGPVITYNQNPLSVTDKSSKQIVAETYRNIQNYTISEKFDVIESLLSGMYSSRMLSLNLLKMNVDVNDFHYILTENTNVDAFYKLDSLGNYGAASTKKITPNSNYYNQLVTDTGESFGVKIDANNTTGVEEYLKEIFDNSVRGKRTDWYQEIITDSKKSYLKSRFKHLNKEPFSRFTSDNLYAPQSRYFFNNTTSGIDQKIGGGGDKSSYVSEGELPNRIEDIFQQRMSQLRQLKSVVVNLDVVGHTGRTVGQVVNIILPTRVADVFKNDKFTNKKNELFSGEYLVTKVTHILNQESGGSFRHNMKLELRTDSTNLTLNSEKPDEEGLDGPTSVEEAGNT